jgi:hypothetical protein
MSDTIRPGVPTRLYFGIYDASGMTVPGQFPTISIRRVSDGWFFNGTGFVNTSGTPSQLAMTEIGAPTPGLYLYIFTSPSLIAPLAQDTYEIRYRNTGTPTGESWEIRNVANRLLDINVAGA